MLLDDVKINTISFYFKKPRKYKSQQIKMGKYENYKKAQNSSHDSHSTQDLPPELQPEEPRRLIKHQGLCKDVSSYYQKVLLD